MKWLALALSLWAGTAFAQCTPVPDSFPLTQTAVSTNFARLYGCINGGGVVPPGVITVATTFLSSVTVRGTLTLLSWLLFPSGVYAEAHDGVLWLHTTGADAPSFGETNLGVTILTKKGLRQVRILVGPENSGGIGYRMLRVPNLPPLE